jgi:c-di-GMP-binding flagellar brake protein YcgR
MDTTMDAAVASPEVPAATGRTPRWIDNPEAIGHLLSQAAAKRVMLAMGGSDGPRNALLLVADAATQQLILDTPFPALSAPPEPGTTLSLATRLDGAAMDFMAVFERFTELDGEQALLLRWPERLRYLQRRNAYRLGIPRDLHVPPATLRDRRGPVKATLVDLSRFGAGAIVSRHTDLRPGECLDCTIRVDDVEFTASAEVRSCIATLDRLRLGLQFGEISPGAAARLSAAVAKLERVSLRRAAERRGRVA